jgi:hypothetical protein
MKNKRNYYIQDPVTGKIRFTSAFIDLYGAQYAKAGFDLRKITTITLFNQATDVVMSQKLRAVADEFQGQDPRVDRIMAGLPGWD